MQHDNTLKKLSEKLNLSISTISRALKNHPDISESTKSRVKELAEMLEYEPNNFAIQLRTNKSNELGIIVPSVSNFFYDSFIAAVEEDARRHGYSVLIMQSGDSAELEIENLKSLKNHRITGVFVSVTTCTTDISAFLKLQDSGIPVIFFDRVPEFEACNKVCLSDDTAASIAAKELIQKQKKNVLALFGHPALSISQKRAESFKKTFELLSPETKLDIKFSSDEEAKYITKQYLEKEDRPDAIFCMGDLLLISAMQSIFESTLRVPEDIGVISISNGFIPALFNPKITYVETSGYKLGKLAFSRMLECVNGKTFIRKLYIDSFLIPGGSL